MTKMDELERLLKGVTPGWIDKLLLALCVGPFGALCLSVLSYDKMFNPNAPDVIPDITIKFWEECAAMSIAFGSWAYIRYRGKL